MILRQQLIKRIKANKELLHLALKLYSFAHPPPYRRPNMEFEADAWSGISSLYYQGGRQLGEDNSGPYPFREITHNSYEICQFGDSRLGLPMNVTNLHLALPYAADTYQLTTVLRNRYIADRGLTDSRFNLVQAYLFSKFSASLPSFLVRRKDHPIRDGEIEPLEAAFFMLGAAPFILVRQLIARGDRTPLDAEPKSGDALYVLSSDSRTLISPRECACPAAPKLIIDYYDVIMNGSYDGPLDSPSIDRVFERIGDWRRLYDYTLAASRLDLLVLLNKAITLQFFYRLCGEAALLSAGIVQQVQTGLAGPLSLSYAGAPAGQELRTASDVAVEVFTALLRDHGDTETLDELARAEALPDSASPSMAPGDVARRIREASTVIHRSCLRDLRSVHTALGNSRWPSISTEDLLRRTGGPALAEHLRRLDSIGFS